MTSTPIRTSSLLFDDIPLSKYVKYLNYLKRKAHAKQTIEKANRQLVEEIKHIKRYGMLFPSTKTPKVHFGSNNIILF